MSRKLLVGIVLAGAGSLALLLGLSEPEPLWVRGSLSDFVARPVREKTVRLSGVLVKGSLCRVTDPCEYRFRLTDHFWPASESAPPARSSELSVRFPSCAMPHTVRDVPGLDVDVTIVGQLCATCHDFQASQIMAKCPGKYEISVDEGHHHSAPKVPPCAAR